MEVVRVNAGLDDTAWFETITLEEPDKIFLANSSKQQTEPRTAYVCCYEPSSNRTFTGKVSLSTDALLDWKHVKGVQARIVPEELPHARPAPRPSGKTCFCLP